MQFPKFSSKPLSADWRGSTASWYPLHLKHVLSRSPIASKVKMWFWPCSRSKTWAILANTSPDRNFPSWKRNPASHWVRWTQLSTTLLRRWLTVPQIFDPDICEVMAPSYGLNNPRPEMQSWTNQLQPCSRDMSFLMTACTNRWMVMGWPFIASLWRELVKSLELTQGFGKSVHIAYNKAAFVAAPI